MIRHDLHDILYPAIQRRTNLHEYLRGNMSVPSHFGDGCWADTSPLAQVFFLHVLIDEQLPEFEPRWRNSGEALFLPHKQPQTAPGYMGNMW